MGSEIKSFVEEIGKLEADETVTAEDERIWNLLDRIDAWKRKAEGASSSSASEIAEVETALLPLVIKAETHKAASSRRVSSTSEDASEIAGFTDNLELHINGPNFLSTLSRSQRWRISNVVAVLGDTHAGVSSRVFFS